MYTKENIRIRYLTNCAVLSLIHIFGAATGVPNTFILYFSLRAVSVLPAYIVFPAYSAGVILLVNIFNYFVFRESLSKQEKVATGLVAIALILINL